MPVTIPGPYPAQLLYLDLPETLTSFAHRRAQEVVVNSGGDNNPPNPFARAEGCFADNLEALTLPGEFNIVAGGRTEDRTP